MTPSTDSSRQVAVLLNANARLVTDKVKRSLERIVPRANLFLSHTKEEALDYVKHIIDNRYATIFSGGGDGSFVHLLNLARDYLKGKKRPGEAEPELPQFGILKLGTGNGISSFVGSRGGTRLLERSLHAHHLDTLEMSLIERNDRIFHFAGSGFDARLLKDYYDFMDSLKTPAARKNFSGLVGYFWSGLGKTVPESIIKPDRGEVRVEIETGDQGFYVKHTHGRDQAVATESTLLYSGPSTAVAVATEPFYGYNVRAFPFATMKPGFMNLRVLLAQPVSLVANMRDYWNGTYRGRGVKDFLVRKVKITYEKPTPIQVGGDYDSLADSITYSIFPQKCKLVDFRHLAHLA